MKHASSKTKWRRVVLSVAATAAFAAGVGVVVSAKNQKSEDPKDWIVEQSNGQQYFDETRVPERIRVATGPETFGYMTSDVIRSQKPGTRPADGPWPVFDSPQGGKVIGMYSTADGYVPLAGNRPGSCPDAATPVCAANG